MKTLLKTFTSYDYLGFPIGLFLNLALTEENLYREK